MTRTIGGPLGVQQLAQLLGDLPGRGDPPAHLLALQDAHDRLRQAAAALRACEHPDASTAARLGVVHAVLVDQLAELALLRGAP
jgi:hypothetical protein